MKKFLFATFAVAIMFASCSKEHKLNKDLDGSWNVTSIDGAPLANSGETMFIKFDKDKKGKGIVTFTDTYGGSTDTYVGTYDLTKDKAITMTIVGDVEVWTIVSYSKTNLTISFDGSTLVASKL